MTTTFEGLCEASDKQEETVKDAVDNFIVADESYAQAAGNRQRLLITAEEKEIARKAMEDAKKKLLDEVRRLGRVRKAVVGAVQ